MRVQIETQYVYAQYLHICAYIIRQLAKTRINRKAGRDFPPQSKIDDHTTRLCVLCDHSAAAAAVELCISICSYNIHNICLALGIRTPVRRVHCGHTLHSSRPNNRTMCARNRINVNGNKGINFVPGRFTGTFATPLALPARNFRAPQLFDNVYRRQ